MSVDDEARMDPWGLRALNDRAVDALLDFHGDEAPATVKVMCECPSRECEEMLELPLEHYRSARSGEDCFIVRFGHAIPPHDHVLVRTPEYWLAAPRS